VLFSAIHKHIVATWRRVRSRLWLITHRKLPLLQCYHIFPIIQS